MKEKRSDDYYVDIPAGLSKREMGEIVERAADRAGLYVSHIGGRGGG